MTQRSLPQRPKHLAANPASGQHLHAPLGPVLSAPEPAPGTGPEYGAHAHGARSRQPGGIRPGEGRFDPRAWRDTVKDEALARQAPPVLERQAPPVKSNAGAPRGTPAAHQPRSAPLAVEQPHGAVPRLSVGDVPGAIAAAAPARDGGSRWRYLAVWAVLGSCSAAYVAGMAWQRTANFNIAIVPVTEAIERMAGDIADLKQVTTAIDARERATADRVASAESRLSRFADTGLVATQVASTSGQRPTNRAVLAEEPTSLSVSAVEPLKPQRLMAGVVLAQPGTPPGLVVGPAAVPTKADARAAGAAKAGAVNPVKTGGLPEAVPATVPAAAGRRQAGLLVASGPSLDAMRLSWSVLSQNHGGALGPVEPRVQQAGDGSIFQLVAGPYATDADAAKACASLRARGVTCRMADFGGAAL